MTDPIPGTLAFVEHELVHRLAMNGGLSQDDALTLIALELRHIVARLADLDPER